MNDRPTTPAPRASTLPTFPPYSGMTDREGVLFTERLFASVRTCGSDGTRFMAGCAL